MVELGLMIKGAVGQPDVFTKLTDILISMYH